MFKTLCAITLLLALATVALAETDATYADSSKLSGGLGIGIMYGGFGTNLEYRLTEQASVTAGIGMDGHSQWLAGGRFYFKPEGRGARGRFTVGVGEIDAENTLFPDSHRKSMRGVAGIGWSWANADNSFKGWDIDLTTKGRLSFGYHF